MNNNEVGVAGLCLYEYANEELISIFMRHTALFFVPLGDIWPDFMSPQWNLRPPNDVPRFACPSLTFSA